MKDVGIAFTEEARDLELHLCVPRVGVINRFRPLDYFPDFQIFWGVSTQLSCGDTRQLHVTAKVKSLLTHLNQHLIKA